MAQRVRKSVSLRSIKAKITLLIYPIKGGITVRIDAWGSNCSNRNGKDYLEADFFSKIGKEEMSQVEIITYRKLTTSVELPTVSCQKFFIWLLFTQACTHEIGYLKLKHFWETRNTSVTVYHTFTELMNTSNSDTFRRG